MERTKRKSSVYNDYVPYGGRVPNFKEKEGMKLKKEQFDVTGMTCSACSARIEKSVSKLPGIKEVSVNLLKNSIHCVKSTSSHHAYRYRLSYQDHNFHQGNNANGRL